MDNAVDWVFRFGARQVQCVEQPRLRSRLGVHRLRHVAKQRQRYICRQSIAGTSFSAGCRESAHRPWWRSAGVCEPRRDNDSINAADHLCHLSGHVDTRLDRSLVCAALWICQHHGDGLDAPATYQLSASQTSALGSSGSPVTIFAWASFYYSAATSGNRGGVADCSRVRHSRRLYFPD